MDDLIQSRLVLSAFALVALRSLYSLMRHIRVSRRRQELLSIACQKAAEREAIRRRGIPQPVSQELQRKVLRMNVTELLAALDQGTLTSVDIMRVYCHRASTIGANLDLVAEENYDEALKAAEEADAARARAKKTGEKLGMLHGIPISLKDQIDQRGFDSTCGLAVRCFKPAKDDGLLAQLLRKQGAIFFVRSNVPQCLLLPESMNAIWGTAKNPFDPARTPGGSSGGEAGLIASGCSPLGVGTDIGGSIRIPAHLCGIYGFKPTPTRITSKGIAIPRPREVGGNESIRSTAGPMGRSVDDLWLMLSSLIVPEVAKADPHTAYIPLQEAEFKSTKKLRIGYYVDDGFFTPAPSCIRAVHQAVNALEAAGHEVVKFDLPRGFHAATIYYALMSADGRMRGLVDALEGESLHSTYDALYRISRVPELLRKPLAALLHVLGEKRSSALFTIGGAKSAYEFWQYVSERTLYQREFLSAWTDARLDALIAPGLGLPAWPHSMAKELTPACSYTFLYNLLHYPAGTVPVTTVRADETVYSDTFNDRYTKLAAKVLEGAVGLPVGVQVVSLPFHDEVALRVMKDLEKHISFVNPLLKA
eukprot:GILK01002626.1.p1 GENE.GILK01002626.1~~GILK01002626.1.p1  ORF type:complete len:609 (+),score=87.34 GILK01002626.1:56-1828(+)